MMQTANGIAEAIGAKLEGDGAVEVRGVAAPERAGPHDLIYVEKAKHADRAAASAALCVVAAESVMLPGKTVLRSSQPKVAFAKAAALLLGKAPIATGIHPTAIVAPLARISQKRGHWAVCGDRRRRTGGRRHANRGA
jgi:UDP-3-O-[3-hydroxymyristoyl] glucosamine N-acyltransferase